MDRHEIAHDPYRRCEDHCNHDLARGVTLAELFGVDGPFRDAHLIVNFAFERAVEMAPPELAAAG